jgi:phage FluMu gp28-like protein
MIGKEKENVPYDFIQEKASFVLGVDLAKTTDETALVILECLPFEDLNICPVFVSSIETYQRPLNEIIERIYYLHSIYSFKKIYIDMTGMGEGVVDMMNTKMRGLIEGVKFTLNSKAEMFTNMKLMMEKGRLKIPDYTKTNDEKAKKLFYQFLTINKEYGKSEVPRFTHESGKHDDIICALALACLYFNKRRLGGKKYSLVSLR